MACGLDAIQLNLALAGGASLPDEVPPALRDRIRTAVQARGLDVVAVSGTYNMAHPDAGVRREGLRRLRALVAAAPTLGTRLVTLCTGTRDREDQWRAHPDNATPQAWADMAESVAAAAATAAEHGVVLGVEPETGNVVSGAAQARRLLDELASPHVGIVLDAANLIRAGELGRQARTLDEAFALLGGDLALAHAKDVLDDGTVVPAGAGGLDYARFIRLLAGAAYDGALVLHALEPPDVARSATFLRRHLDQI